MIDVSAIAPPVVTAREGMVTPIVNACLTDPFVLRFIALVCPRRERWLPALTSEVYAIAHEYGTKLHPSSQEFEVLLGRVQIRINALDGGFELPLTANTTLADIYALAQAQYKGDWDAAMSDVLCAMAHSAWDRYWSPKVRDLLVRQIIGEELPGCEQLTRQ